MNYKYKTMEEVALTHTQDEIMFALELMDVDFEESQDKEDLVKKLVETQKNHLSEIFHMASYEDLQALEIMSENQGHFIDGDVLTMYKGLFPDNLLDLPEDLCLIAFENESEEEELDLNISYESYCSQEFLNLFQEYLTTESKALAFALDEMARIIKGSLYYYGAVEINELYEIVSSKYKELNRNLFKTVLGYKHSLFFAYESEIFEDKEYITNEFFDYFYKISEVKKWKETIGEYKNIEREALFEAGDDLFIEDKEAYKKVASYFEAHFVPPVEAEDEDIDFAFEDDEFLFGFIMLNTVELLQRALNHNEIVEDFLGDFDFETTELANNGLTLLANYINNLSRWDNLGFSPDELIRKNNTKNNVISMGDYQKKDEN